MKFRAIRSAAQGLSRAACLALLLNLPALLGAAGPLQVAPRLHKWGAEIDLGISPFIQAPGRETSLWGGIEGVYKTWGYFHDSRTGAALNSAKLSEAAVKEALGLWFLGATQGLAPQGAAPDGGGHWENASLLEAFVYYRGAYYRVLSAGSYLADSTAPDKNGYLESAFIGGLSLDRLTELDSRGLREGFLVETSATLAPRPAQSVAVDYGRLTLIGQGYLPLWDVAPDASLNRLSLLGAVNLALDHLWGDSIPSEERQLIGGRAWNGIGGFVEGVGGAVRGIEDGRLDGATKAVVNAELRLNLPGFEIVNPTGLAPLGRSFRFLPGLIAYVDGGLWSGLQGQDSGAVLSAGAGAYLSVFRYGSLAVYLDRWIAGGTPYEPAAIHWHVELGMHF
jgi:hypothetical protein